MAAPSFSRIEVCATDHYIDAEFTNTDGVQMSANINLRVFDETIRASFPEAATDGVTLSTRHGPLGPTIVVTRDYTLPVEGVVEISPPCIRLSITMPKGKGKGKGKL